MGNPIKTRLVFARPFLQKMKKVLEVILSEVLGGLVTEVTRALPHLSENSSTYFSISKKFRVVGDPMLTQVDLAVKSNEKS